MSISRQPNFYSDPELDRAGPWRKDAAWVEAQLGAPETRFLPVWRAQHLLAGTEEAPTPLFLARDAFGSRVLTEESLVLLGLVDGAAHFAVDLSDDETLEPRALSELPDARFQDLRAVGPLLARRDGALLGYAKGLLHWHSRHRFCGVCGAATRAAEAGHVRRCTSPSCGTSHFPRTDPAVIMLVTDGDRALLGRQPSWPPGMYSTLAGFVEPGESLEDAVAREVFEEAGIKIRAATYQSSQPWPFPASIMLGFRAAAVSTEIRVDQAELQDAQWFSRGWLMANRAGSESFRLPRLDSIARRLIEEWLAEDF